VDGAEISTAEVDFHPEAFEIREGHG
jgi:hypothetical protein